jgi:hypothetical protein
MKTSKIEHLLKALKTHELPLLEKFISSPYFNSKKDIILFFDFLYQNIKKDKTNFNLGTREEAFLYIYPNTPFDNIKIIKLTSDLVNLVQQFYVNQEIRYDNLLNKYIYIDALSSRNLDNQFIQESNKLISLLEASPAQDAKIHLDLYLLKKGLHFHQGKLVSKNDLLNLTEVQKRLDTYYLLSKLQLICEVTCLQNTFEEHIEIPLSETIKELSLKYSSESILFPLYLQNLHNIQNIKDSGSLDSLVSTFFNNLNLLSHNEQLSLFILILNTNGMKINSGHSDGIKTQFELYKRALENNILIRNNRITPESFTNIVVLATHLNKLKWAENFIKNNSKHLPQNIREACILFCRGKITFKQDKFEETLKLLWNCRFDQLAFDLRTKSFTIRTLFEIFNKNKSSDQYEFCMGQILTIEKFIRRRKNLSKTKANSYLNFIKTTKRLLKLTSNNNLTFLEAKKIKTKISTYDNIIARSWLLEKSDII